MLRITYKNIAFGVNYRTLKLRDIFTVKLSNYTAFGIDNVAIMYTSHLDGLKPFILILWGLSLVVFCAIVLPVCFYVEYKQVSIAISWFG